MTDIESKMLNLEAKLAFLESEIADLRSEVEIDDFEPEVRGGEGSDPATFTGEAYDPAGNKTTGLTDNAKPWVKYNINSGAITEEIGPTSFPWGVNEIWRKKSDYSGAIYF